MDGVRSTCASDARGLSTLFCAMTVGAKECQCTLTGSDCSPAQAVDEIGVYSRIYTCFQQGANVSWNETDEAMHSSTVRHQTEREQDTVSRRIVVQRVAERNFRISGLDVNRRRGLLRRRTEERLLCVRWAKLARHK